MGAPRNQQPTSAQPQTTNSVTHLIVNNSSAEYLHELSKNLSPDALKILADLSKKPGIEKKLKENVTMLKMFL